MWGGISHAACVLLELLTHRIHKHNQWFFFFTKVHLEVLCYRAIVEYHFRSRHCRFMPELLRKLYFTPIHCHSIHRRIYCFCILKNTTYSITSYHSNVYQIVFLISLLFLTVCLVHSSQNHMYLAYILHQVF